MQQQVRVHYGQNKIITATLLEEVNEGILKGWNKLRMPNGHECYMSAKSIATEQTDTDWRKYLKTHWDTAHNYLRPDCAEEFMTIFNRAAAYIKIK